MPNVKVDLSESFREIMLSVSNSSKSPEERKEELDFYRSVFETFLSELGPSYSSLIPIRFEVCPLEKAKQYALSLGMHIVEGSSGRHYLDFAKGINF